MNDTLGRVKENGIFKWKFRKTKDTLPPENYSYVTKCMQASGVAHFIKYGAGQYKIVDVRTLLTDGKFRVVDSDDWNFKVIENRATMERRMSKMDRLMQFAPLIGLGLVTVLFIVVSYFSYNYMKEIVGSCGTVAAQKITEASTATAVKSPLDLLKPGN